MDTDKPKLKKILILYARAGNGHYSQAKSLQEYLLKFAPNQFEIKLVDGLAGNSEFTQKRFTEGYQLLSFIGFGKQLILYMKINFYLAFHLFS
jgi:hypothetical protein